MVKVKNIETNEVIEFKNTKECLDHFNIKTNSLAHYQKKKIKIKKLWIIIHRDGNKLQTNFKKKKIEDSFIKDVKDLMRQFNININNLNKKTYCNWEYDMFKEKLDELECESGKSILEIDSLYRKFNLESLCICTKNESDTQLRMSLC